jgi:hypothetical protein
VCDDVVQFAGDAGTLGLDGGPGGLLLFVRQPAGFGRGRLAGTRMLPDATGRP